MVGKWLLWGGLALTLWSCSPAAGRPLDEIDRMGVEYYLEQGVEKFYIRDYRGAIEEYSRALAIDPRQARGYNRRGNAWAELGDKRAAIADFDQTIALDANYLAAFHNRGLAHRALGNLEAAVADFSEAIRINPNFPDAYLDRGLTLLRLGRRDAATADLQWVANRDPKKMPSRFHQRATEALRQLQAP